MAKKISDGLELYDANSMEMQELLYARHVEVESLSDLEHQRGTPIPAMFNQFYKFIQNPSSVSVDTFKRMIDTDDTLGSGTDFLTTCLAARLGRYTHPSKEISEWTNKRLEEIEGGQTNMVKEMLSASWAGFYAGEKVWANTVNGFVINHVAPLPPTTVLFEVDRSGRITEDGILQYQRSWNPHTLASGIGFMGTGGGYGFTANNGRPDPWARLGDMPFPMRTGNTYNYLCVRIPKMKVIHYAFDAQGKFGNPYGRSLLRRAYKWWVLKDGIARMLSIALDRKGTPLTLVYSDPHATVQDPTKTTTTSVGNGGNQKGRQVGMRLDLALREAFKNIHNDSVIFLPGKKDTMVTVDSHSQEANADAFISALDFCNKSLLRALLVPALIFGGGDGTGSYSLGQEHAKTFDKILDGMNGGLKQTLREQLIKEMIAYNFPKSAWEKDGFGEFANRELSNDERQKEMEVCEKGVNMGAIDMNDLDDLNTIRQKAGFREREEIIERPEDLLGDGMGGLGDEGEDRQEDRQEKPKEKKPAAKAARRRRTR